MISAIYANLASRMDQDDNKDGANNNDDKDDHNDKFKMKKKTICATPVISAAGCAICANQASNYSDLMKMKKTEGSFRNGHGIANIENGKYSSHG